MTAILGRWLGRQALLAAVEDMVAKATRDANGTLPDTHPSRASVAGDPGKLRGVPVVGVKGGFGGAI